MLSELTRGRDSSIYILVEFFLEKNYTKKNSTDIQRS